MKHYEIWGRLSGGSVICDPLDAENTEEVTRIALDRTPKAKEYLPQSHPGEELEEVEIYELVKVSTIDSRPKVARV